MRYIIVVYTLLFFAHASTGTAHELTLETIPGHGCWVDPRVNKNRLESFESQHGLNSSYSVTALRISGGWRHCMMQDVRLFGSMSETF